VIFCAGCDLLPQACDLLPQACDLLPQACDLLPGVCFNNFLHFRRAFA